MTLATSKKRGHKGDLDLDAKYMSAVVDEDYTREGVDFDCERISHPLRGMIAVSFTLPRRRCIIFMRSPYSYTKTQLEQVLRVFAVNEAYQDIKTLVTWNHVLYMYSEQHMDFKYARALAEYAETDEGDV